MFLQQFYNSSPNPLVTKFENGLEMIILISGNSIRFGEEIQILAL